MKKIIIFGSLSCDKGDLYNEAKKHNIDHTGIEFVDYEACKRYDAKKIVRTNKYCVIICGPMPHKAQNIGKYRSFVDKIKVEKSNNCPTYFLKKITITSFKEVLTKIDSVKNSKKLFSIVIPYYDTYEVINDTFESIAKQDFDLKQVEVIIVSDGAKKSIANLVKRYQNLNIFGRFEMFKKENGNWGSVINYVKKHKLINADYFTILDSDDKLEPQCLKTFAKYIQENQNVDVLTSKFYFWKAKCNQKQERKIYFLSRSQYFTEIDDHYFKNAYSFPLCKFYRTQLFYESDICLLEKQSFQDVCLYYGMRKYCHTWQYINEYLGCYRCDRDNSSSNELWSAKKMQWWKETIEFLSNNDSGCVARFYLLANHFPKHYKLFVKQQENHDDWKITLKREYAISHVPKSLKLITRLFLFFVVLFNKKIIKLV